MTLFTPDINVFPMNAIEVIVARMQDLWVSSPADGNPDVVILKRRLQPQDPTQSIGVFPMTWTPDPTSFEFGRGKLLGGYPNNLSNEPTIQVHAIGVHAFVQDTDEQRGIATHAAMAKAIRSMLYNDGPLAIGLDELSSTTGTVTEKIQRRYVDRTRYIDNLISGKYVYLSTTQYNIETETK